MSNLHETVIRFVSDVLQVEIPPDIDDLDRRDCEEWDSVNHLRLVMELEDVFGITLDDEQAMELVSLRQVESLMVSRGVIPGDGVKG